MNPYIDLVRIALKTPTNTIPRAVPAHYVRWAYGQHIRARKLKQSISGPAR
jgi:hypothetical protein